MLQRLLSLFTPHRRRLSRPVRAALRLEALEDRWLPAPLFTGVKVSDIGPGTNHIAEANTSRNVAVAPNGTIYVEFYGDNGIRVARSTNRGHSFFPSVQVTGANSEADLVVGANGVVYVAWVENTMSGNEAMISRSTNGGVTFSAPAMVGLVDAEAVHLAVQSHYVYLVPDHGGSDTGRIVFANSTSGVGAFTTATVDTNGREFADIQVNPNTGQVFVVSDDPTLRLFRSSNHGATFTPVPLSNPNAAIYFSATTASFSSNGAFLFVSGGNFVPGSDVKAYRINLATGGTTSLKFGSNTDNQGRSLAASGFNVVDTFFHNGFIQYQVSHNNGATFAPTVTVAQADSANVAINPSTGDIVIAYEKNGNIFVNVYAGELFSLWGWGSGPPWHF